MTFSIVARCDRTAQLGVGALTAMMGIGKVVSHAKAGVGAVATQATMNPYLGFDGLRALEEGMGAEAALEKLIAADPGRDYRQCGIVDATGAAAAWSGSRNPHWAGHRVGDGYAAQGNRLVGEETIEAAVAAFVVHPEEPLVERLMLALEAGESTGADKHGERSGTLYVMDTEEYPLWDVRIDHADDPAASLRQLYGEMAEGLVAQIRQLSTRADPLGEMTRRQMQRE